MKIRFDVCNSNFSMRFESQKEAFELAKKLASNDCFVTMTRIAWNDSRRIVGYETCKINANGTYEFL